MAENSKQTIITALSIVVALVAVAYALMSNVEKPTVKATVPAVQVTEVTYEKGSDNPVVMVVNGKEVTRMEVLDNFAASGSQLPPGTDLEAIFPLLQDQYLVGALLKNAALDAGINKDTPEVAQALNNALSQALRAQYIKVLGEEEVTQDDLVKAYEDIVANAPDVVERRASHILVSDEAKAKDLIKQLEEGADFATLAKDNSEGPTSVKGGDLGFFAQSEMVPEFANAAFTMEIGDVSSEPVKTQFGYHIIKVVDERKREKPTFEEVKPQLEGQLRQAAIAQKLQELRQNSQITVYNYDGEEVPAPEDAAPAADVQPEPMTAPEEETKASEEPAAPTPAEEAQPQAEEVPAAE